MRLPLELGMLLDPGLQLARVQQRVQALEHAWLRGHVQALIDHFLT
jgi:hypothetical protein